MFEPRYICEFHLDRITRIWPEELAAAEFGYRVRTTERLIKLLNMKSTNTAFKICTLNELFEGFKSEFERLNDIGGLTCQLNVLVRSLAEDKWVYNLPHKYGYEIKKRIFIFILKLIEAKLIVLAQFDAHFLESINFANFKKTLNKLGFVDRTGNPIFLKHSSIDVFKITTHRGLELDVFGDSFGNSRLKLTDDLYDLAMIQIENDNCAFGVKLLELGLALPEYSNRRSSLYNLAGICYTEINDFKKAQECYLGALQTGNEHGEHINLGNYLGACFQRNDKQAAIEALNIYFDSMKDHSKSYVIEKVQEAIAAKFITLDELPKIIKAYVKS